MREDFKKRLVLLMKGDKPYSWARKVGIEKGLFQYYWQKGKIPTYHNLLKIQEFTGCSLDWLLTGKAVSIEELERLQGKDVGAPKGSSDLAKKSAKTVATVKSLYASRDWEKISIFEGFVTTIAPQITTKKRGGRAKA